jgi:protein involved in polysaccharide export with SLBB domain
MSSNTYRFVRLLALQLLLAVQLDCSGGHQGVGKLPPPRIPTTAAASATGEPVFKAGDSVELLVEEDRAFDGVFEVREGGYVLIPKVGRITVAGMTRSTVEKDIRDKLQHQQLKRATVYVELRPGQTGNDYNAVTGSSGQHISIFLTGAVARPGLHALQMRSDGRFPGVFEVLLTTGGLSKFGDESKVRIMRPAEGGTRQPLQVDVRKIRDGLTADVPVGDGDIIEVREKVFGF